jgi:hypothetical protein
MGGTVTDLMLDAGYHNLSFKLKDIQSVVENVVKYLTIGKCRCCTVTVIKINCIPVKDNKWMIDLGCGSWEKIEEDVYEFWLSFVRGTTGCSWLLLFH